MRLRKNINKTTYCIEEQGDTRMKYIVRFGPHGATCGHVHETRKEAKRCREKFFRAVCMFANIGEHEHINKLDFHVEVV